MAISAFKSSSRRGGSTSATPYSSSGVSSSGKDSKQSDNSSKKATMRRSRSVSAFSRSSSADVSAEFSNSRDNPLFFWSDGLPPSEGARSVNVEFDESSTRISAESSKRASNSGVESTRGRSVSRNSDSGSIGCSGNRKSGVRSLSRVGAERRGRSTSVSRYPVSSSSVVNSESDAERDSRSSMKSINRRTPDSVLRGRREVGLVSRSCKDALQQSKGLRTRSSQLLPFDLSDNCDASVPCSFEDRLSTASSLSEAEERMVRVVCEQMKSMKGNCLQGRSGASDIYDIIQYEVRRAVQDIHNDLLNAPQSADVVGCSNIDIPPELVNPGEVELVDLRSEYTKKLEQSHERARQLRADLEVEEHRGLELSRILREVIPAPKASMRRKASIERRRMSKRLTDDALAYFDECVSLSTFDGSDFSSMEETPPIHQVFCPTEVRVDNPQESSEIEQYNLRKSQFSITNKKPEETHGIHQDIGKYIQNCEKEDVNKVASTKQHCDVSDRILQNPTESFLFDQFVSRTRIQSGGMLLCSATSSSSFYSYFR